MKKNIKGVILSLLGVIAWLTIMHIPQAIAAYAAGSIVNDGFYGVVIFGLLVWLEFLWAPVLFNWGVKAWARVPVAIVGLFVLIPASMYVVQLNNNRWGERATKHDQKYVAQGASGVWIPSKLKWDWVDNIWGNPTDGCYGQDNGLWSMIMKGKEYSWWGVYRWLALHNPTNAFVISNKFMACHVPSCTITVTGDEFLSDRDPVLEGRFFVTATDEDTGSKYYGFRLVHQWSNGKVLNLSFGNKLKPEHRTEVFEPRKEMKGFTARLQIMTSTY